MWGKFDEIRPWGVMMPQLANLQAPRPSAAAMCLGVSCRTRWFLGELWNNLILWGWIRGGSNLVLKKNSQAFWGVTFWGRRAFFSQRVEIKLTVAQPATEVIKRFWFAWDFTDPWLRNKTVWRKEGKTKQIPSLLMPGSQVWHMVSSVYLPIFMVNVGR